MQYKSPSPSTKSTMPIVNQRGLSLHRIVIVGGGAGGLELATRLGDTLGKKGKAHVTLIEKTRTHIWKPLLYEVAAGSLDANCNGVDFLTHGHTHGFQFRYGALSGLDRGKRLVHVDATFDDEGRQITPARSFSYDTLVVAIGSIGNDLGTPGADQHAIMLDTVEEAQRFNKRLFNAFVRAYAQPEPIGPSELHIAIIGGGATGTELAAELHKTTRRLVAYGLDKIDADRDVKISLIEASGRILPALPEHIATSAAHRLQSLGIEIKTMSRVSEVTPSGVVLDTGEILASEHVVWAAGVKGPGVLAELDGLDVTRSNQLRVHATLQSTRDADIFAIGDCAYCIPDGSDLPVPPRAQAAHQQATHMYWQIRRRLRGKPLRRYIYRDFGTLVALGEGSTFGVIMRVLPGRRLFLEGWFAGLMYRSLHKMHQAALHGLVYVGLETLGRILTERGTPKVKLH